MLGVCTQSGAHIANLRERKKQWLKVHIGIQLEVKVQGRDLRWAELWFGLVQLALGSSRSAKDTQCTVSDLNTLLSLGQAASQDAGKGWRKQSPKRRVSQLYSLRI